MNRKFIWILIILGGGIITLGFISCEKVEQQIEVLHPTHYSLKDFFPKHKKVAYAESKGLEGIRPVINLDSPFVEVFFKFNEEFDISEVALLHLSVSKNEGIAESNIPYKIDSLGKNYSYSIIERLNYIDSLYVCRSKYAVARFPNFFQIVDSGDYDIQLGYYSWKDTTEEKLKFRKITYTYELVNIDSIETEKEK